MQSFNYNNSFHAKNWLKLILHKELTSIVELIFLLKNENY